MGTCVIYNPAAGRGLARRLIAKLRRERGGTFDFRPTSAAGHGRELAERAVEAGHDTVIAAGGDGTVHEVANGVLRAGRAGVVFGVWPIGSANDYAYALGVGRDWPLCGEARGRLVKRAVDGGRVTGGRPVGYFVDGLRLGFYS